MFPDRMTESFGRAGWPIKSSSFSGLIREANGSDIALVYHRKYFVKCYAILHKSMFKTRKKKGPNKGRNKWHPKTRSKDAKSVKPVKVPGKSPIPKEEPYPMRINKYLSSQGYSTRRDADKLIAKKIVFINGKLAVLGSKVNEKDLVEVKRKEKPQKYSYFAYNKPKGVITHSPPARMLSAGGQMGLPAARLPKRGQATSTAQAGEKDIEHSVNLEGKYVFPVGRLDKDSHGLIILTDDGRVTDRLLNPEHEHEKEYVVTVRNNLRPSFKMHMEAGVDIEGYRTKKCKVTILGDHSFKITITEGKKHQIRRMCANLHNDVADLTRIRVMNIRLGAMKPNAHREIVGKELEIFLGSIGL